MKFYEDPENKNEAARDSVFEMDSDTEACSTDDSLSEDYNRMSSEKFDKNMEDDSKDGIVLYLKPLTKENEENEEIDSRSVVCGVNNGTPREYRPPPLLELPTSQNNRETNPRMFIPSIPDHMRDNPFIDADDMNAYIRENISARERAIFSMHQNYLDESFESDEVSIDRY